MMMFNRWCDHPLFSAFVLACLFCPAMALADHGIKLELGMSVDV
jgi:hypothetical protein